MIVGKNTIIASTAKISDTAKIGNHVVIYEGSIIGENVWIDDHAVIGKMPMKASTSAVTKNEELEPAEIGDGCIIGTNTIIYRGAKIDKNCLIADQATIRENVGIGEKTIIGRGVAIENRCSIGSFCKIETNAYITALSTIEDHVFVAPNVTTSNDNYLGRTSERFKHFKGIIALKGSRIGAGATILPGITLGRDSLVAAGAVVTKDVEEKVIVAGVPAKRFREVPDEQLLENQ